MENTINTYKESFGEFNNKELYRIGNYLYYGKDKVNPEFIYLFKIPFINHTVIRFTSISLKNENSDKKRFDVIQRIIDPVNKKIKKKYPLIATGNKTFRFCWVNEYGESEDEAHIHILGFVKPDLPKEVKMKIYQYLKYQSRKTIDGVESIHTTTVKCIPGIVSYFCKIENRSGKDYYKKIEFSVGTRSVVEEFYPTPIKSEFFDSTGFTRMPSQ